MVCHMSLQRVGVPKLFIAHRAGVWIHVFMYAPVSFIVTLVGESRSAVLANVRFFSSVQQTVAFHTLQVVELCTANITQIPSLLHATSQMAAKPVRLGETFPALEAHVGFPLGVNRGMSLDV